jgi:hypothetical protein
MELILRGKLQNVFKAKDFLDKDTGLVKTKGKWQLQFLEEQPTDDGVQLLIHKVSIKETVIKDYIGKTGEIVELMVKPFIQGGKVIYYGV